MFLYLSIFVISAASIGYEILLMRLLSIVQWSHFAYMIISLALLGFGVSGTVLAITRRWALGHFAWVYAANATLFGLSSVGCYATAQLIPFNPLEIAWDYAQHAYVFAIYLILSVPFFFAANCIGLVFTRFGGRIGAIYRSDLTGAGAGAFGITAAFFIFRPEDLLMIIGFMGITAAGLGAMDKELFRSRKAAPAFVLVGAVLLFQIPSAWLAPRISEYKGLSQTLATPGAEVIEERSSPLGMVSVVKSPVIPFRSAPGLSLNSDAEPPPQLGLFTDADSMSAITMYDGDPESIKFLDWTPSALAYYLIKKPEVLILGAGGGMDVLQAIYHQARTIDAVELNSKVVDLVRGRFGDFAGGIYERDDVSIHIAEARGYLASGERKYDLIQIALMDSISAASAGVYALNESYLYTVEAFELYLSRLKDGGALAVTRWLELPPRGTLKLFGAIIEALERLGVEEAGSRVAMIRGWNAVTIIVKNGVLTDSEKDSVRAFCEKRSFDIAFMNGMEAGEANRRNKLMEPYFYEGAKALQGVGRDGFVERYKFDIRPATDDRPYFFNFFKWSSAREFFSMIGRGGAPLLEWGYVILIATLAQAVIAGAVLILAPLRSLGPACCIVGRSRVAAYFSLLGLAFMFLEIVFIQKFILFLSHPIYAVAVILSALLIFAGIGAGYSSRLKKHFATTKATGGGWRVTPVDKAVFFIIMVAVLYMLFLPHAFGMFIHYPDAVKIALSIALLAPLGFFMGMPFPLGLGVVAETSPDFVPWAWGINGCASVISAPLATLLAIHFGFTAVIGMAVGLYALAAMSIRGAFLRS